MDEKDKRIEELQDAIHAETSKMYTIARLLRNKIGSGFSDEPFKPVPRSTCAFYLESIVDRLEKVAGPPKEPEL